MPGIDRSRLTRDFSRNVRYRLPRPQDRQRTGPSPDTAGAALRNLAPGRWSWEDKRRGIGGCIAPSGTSVTGQEIPMSTERHSPGPLTCQRSVQFIPVRCMNRTARGRRGWNRTGAGRSDGRRKASPSMDNKMPVVIGTSTSTALHRRFTLTCPWCGTVSVLPIFRMRPLPGCGHVVGRQRRDEQLEEDKH